MLLGNFTKDLSDPNLRQEVSRMPLSPRRWQGLDQAAGRGFHGLTLALHTFLHLACFLPNAEPLHTLISFAWIEASTNILYERRPMLERHLLATTGVMAHPHNPNTTQVSQKPASQGAPVTPQLFQSLIIDMQGNGHPQTRKGQAESASKVARLEV